MKIEFTDDGISLFVQNNYFNNINWNNKEEVSEIIKKLFLQINERYNLNMRGLYKIKIYPHKIGVYIDSIMLSEDNYSGVDIDLRILVIFDKKMYFKIDDYDFISKSNIPYIYKDSYYIDLDDVDDIYKFIEYGEIVLERK